VKRPEGTGIEQYFRRGAFLGRLRACLFAPYWENLIEVMTGRSYARHTIYVTIEHALPFAAFAEGTGVCHARGLTDALVRRYLATLQDHPRKLRASRHSLRLTMRFLRERGVVAHLASPPPTSIPLIEDYLGFMRDHRGISAARLHEHRRQIEPFLAALKIRDRRDISLQPADIHRFVTRTAAGLSPSGRKSLCAALRSFLRFLRLRGWLHRDLVASVPVIPSFKLDRLPRGIARDDIERILSGSMRCGWASSHRSWPTPGGTPVRRRCWPEVTA
jgi:integrase/recombinase XerD